jgi:hypothetical protein
MSNDHTAFFGDDDYSFKLTWKLRQELCNLTGGIGALCTRVFNKQFTFADLHHTIRLALIGGGLSPERAAALINTYAVDRPLIEIYPLALAILDRAWFGEPKHEVANG